MPVSLTLFRVSDLSTKRFLGSIRYKGGRYYGYMRNEETLFVIHEDKEHVAKCLYVGNKLKY